MARVDIGIIINAVNRASPALRGASRDVDNLGRSAQRATGHLRAFQLIVASIVTGALYQMSKNIVQATGSMQSLQIRLANITGSVEKGNEAFKSLSERFAGMPFDIEVIANGFVRMQAAGLGFEKTQKFVESLANAVAAFGGTTQELERGFLGFSQAASKGILSMEELRQQILEAVPVANRLFASQTLDKSIAKFQDRVAKGLVPAMEAIDLFIAAATEAFGNFAELTSFTIEGAMGRIVNIFKSELGRIVTETTLDERLTVIFRNVGDAVRRFMGAIDEQVIASFFEWLRRIANQAEKVISTLLKLGAVVASVLGALVRALDFLPAEAIEFGILGYFILGRAGSKIGRAILIAGTAMITLLHNIGVETGKLLESLSFGFSFGIIGLVFFGPLGAGIIAAIATAWHQAFLSSDKEIDTWLTRTIDKVDEFLNVPVELRRKTHADRSIQKAKEEAAAAGKDIGSSFVDGIFGTPEQTAEVIAKLKELGTAVKLPEVDNTPINKAADKILKTLDSVREKVSDTIRNVSDAMDVIERQIIGDELGEEIARINDAYGDAVDKLEDAIAKATKLNSVTGQENDEIDRMNGLLLRGDILREKAIQKATELYELSVRQAQVDEQINRNNIAGQINDLNRQINPGLFSNTAGAQIINQVEQQRLDLNNQILQSQAQIDELTTRLAYETNPAMNASIQESIASYQQLADASQASLSQLTAEGVATNQFWTSVGDTIYSNVTSAIQGLIEGTLSWRDAMANVFSQLAQMAIEYIAKLLIIKAIEAATGVPTGGGGGMGEPGSAPGFGFMAMGGAFKGNIKPFKDGDIIGGPTMFGIAGEAGTEGILPLERVGGKLGVNAAGMGGDSYSFQVNAIDTQSGVEFLMRNMDSIVGGVRQRGRLNMGLGRTL